MDNNSQRSDLPQDPPPNQTPAGNESASDTSSNLLLKLKMSQNMKLHQCTVCNRRFTNGKALGGHNSSAHVQPGNRQHSSDNLKIDKPKTDSGSASACEIPCSVCGRKFGSQNSLYGHMKSHPERPYRGMNSPTTVKLKIGPQIASTNPSIPKSGFNPGDLKAKGKAPTAGPDQDVKIWMKTGKRGRALVAKSSSSPEEAEEEAFNALVMLRSTNKKQPPLEAEAKPIITAEGNKSELQLISQIQIQSSKTVKPLSPSADEIGVSNMIQLPKRPKLVSSPTNPDDIQFEEPLSSDEKICILALAELKRGPNLFPSPENPSQIETEKNPVEPSPDQNSSIHSHQAFPTHKKKMKIVNIANNKGGTTDKGYESSRPSENP